MKSYLSQRKFFEHLTKINTILFSILVVVVGLDVLKGIFIEDPDLLYPLLYAFLLFALITYVQHLFFGYYDEHIAPLLKNLQRELQQSINEHREKEEDGTSKEEISTQLFDESNIEVL